MGWEGKGRIIRVVRVVRVIRVVRVVGCVRYFGVWWCW